MVVDSNIVNILRTKDPPNDTWIKRIASSNASNQYNTIA